MLWLVGSALGQITSQGPSGLQVIPKSLTLHALDGFCYVIVTFSRLLRAVTRLCLIVWCPKLTSIEDLD